jgi:formylmethanofuran dehydrogenase subunit E
MLALQKPLPETITAVTAVVVAPMQPRCTQCHDPVPVERAAARANAALCEDCALDGMPHTD